MPSDETGKTEEKSQREEIPVPLYFDRYVASELRALGQRITDLKESMDERFAQVDRRFVELKEDMDKRFDKLEKWTIGLFLPLIAGILAIIIKMFIFGK